MCGREQQWNGSQMVEERLKSSDVKEMEVSSSVSVELGCGWKCASVVEEARANELAVKQQRQRAETARKP